MQQKALLFLFFALSSTCSWAQHVSVVKGQVRDSKSSKPIAYATVSLQTGGKVVGGAITASNGQFKLDSILPGIYDLLVECIGYRPDTLRSLALDGSQALPDLKNLVLVADAKVLANVTVTATGKLIENKIDRMVFNAEKDITSQGGVATDILKKIPQVSVDVDGNVELAGSSSIRFLINGKPSTAFGANISDVLQSIPASQIKSIEIITSPGARYDAQGLGGIINIILKQNTARGMNTNIALTAGTRVENGSINVNARRKRFGINASLSGNERLFVRTPQQSQRLGVDSISNTQTTLSVDGINRFRRHGFQSTLGFDWTPNKLHSLTGSYSYNDFGNNGRTQSTQGLVEKDKAGNTLSDVLSYNTATSRSVFRNSDASLNYKRSFSREDEELNILVNTSFGNSNGYPTNQQTMLPGDSIVYGIQASNPAKERETQVQLDYSLPLQHGMNWGIGAKSSWSSITSSSQVNSFNHSAGAYQYNPSLSRVLSYAQQVYALYSELNLPIAKWFDLKAGGRYERTQINAVYAQAKAPIPGYNTWVPSVFLSKKLGKNQLIKLAYSKRIERPDYGDLNPFINTSDPKNIVAGNPYLLPELGQRVELSFSKDLQGLGSVMLTGFYRHNSQDIQPYTKFYTALKIADSVYQNVSVSTRENIGVENNTGLSLFLNINASSKLSVRTNVFGFYRHIINAIDPGLNRSSFNYRFNINTSYQFTPLIAAEFFGNFNSARNEVQGRYPSFTSYSIAIRKMFWNKKASLALTTVNPFNEYVSQRLDIAGTNFTQTAIRKIPFRSFGINFTWKFGKLEFKKEREPEAPVDPGNGP